MQHETEKFQFVPSAEHQAPQAMSLQQQQQQDLTQPVEPFLKKLLLSLDQQFSPQQYANVEMYATQFARQIKPQAAVIINGHPLVPPTNAPDARLEFQKKWLQAPQTNHQLTSFDCHLIPGSNSYVISASGKVRFDESGRNRLGETSNLQHLQPVSGPARFIWGSWFGYSLNLVVDEAVRNNDEMELITSFDYRFTFKPKDSVILV